MIWQDYAISAIEAKAASLFDAIAHGDDEHRKWLKQAIEDHFAGRPVERPRGSGNLERAEAAEADRDAWRAKAEGLEAACKPTLSEESWAILAEFAEYCEANDDEEGPGLSFLIDREKSIRKALAAQPEAISPTDPAVLQDSLDVLGPSADGAVERDLAAQPAPQEPKCPESGKLTVCQASRGDGECHHSLCPQERDGEPAKTGRSCPLPHWMEEPDSGEDG